MTATISKWGNSQGLRVPKEIMEALKMVVGDKVEIYTEDNKVIIKPLIKEPLKHNINNLVAKLPKEYKTKEEIDTRVGLEEW